MRVFGPLVGLALLGQSVPCLAEEPAKIEAGKVYDVPYRLTDVQHLLLRAKINGKGPFNFILDTGAPALFVSTAVCKKLGVEADSKGWGTFDRFEIEGGVKLPKARGRIEDPFQLQGMNGLGLAGAELHGVIGYNVLARFKLEFDFTRDKMKWTALDFVPKHPAGLDGGKANPPEMDAMAGMMKLMGAFLGKKANPDLITRGYLGLELAETDGAVTVASVMTGGPADKAGVLTRDRITRFAGKSVTTADAIRNLAGNLPADKPIKLTVQRGEEKREITLKTGEGL